MHETSVGTTIEENAHVRQKYAAEGYCVSPPLIGRARLNRARTAVEAVIAGRYDTGVPPIYRNWSPGDPPRALVKIDLPHLCNWDLQQLVADPSIGAWAAGVLGANFLQLWACELIYKFPDRARSKAEDQGVIGWHQDDNFWSHWDGEVLTLWLALVDVDARMGPVRYVIGSHRWGAQENACFFSETDLDTQRRLIDAPPGRSWREVAPTLQAGAVSMHHRMTIHGSERNRSGVARVGLALHIRTEHARLLPTSEPPFHRPDPLDTHACPVLFGVAPQKAGGATWNV